MARRIIIGDQEVNIPDKILKLGLIPLLGIGLVLWLLTGVYIVGPDEVGVVQTFGKYTRQAQSGLNYHFPFPFETVQTPKVTEVKRIEIGFRTVGKNQWRTATDWPIPDTRYIKFYIHSDGSANGCKGPKHP